jgi:uncharacterized RDD family membrane protein YckC
MSGDAQLRFETPERVPLALDVAGLGSRALAYLLDALIIFLFWMTALLAYSVVGDLWKQLSAASPVAQVIAVALFFMSGWAYDVAWEVATGGQTPGKRALGLRVVRLDGAPVGLIDSAVRNLTRVLELPLLYAPGVLAVAFTPRHQRLGDLLAGTAVVKERGYDLSRYTDVQRSGTAPLVAQRAAQALSAEEFERVADFLRRRRDLDPAARERIARRVAPVLAGRANLPGREGEPLARDARAAEGFLEALASVYAARPR